jgi:ApbE superfamily uncharacterized protein (UPF0280 family)
VAFLSAFASPCITAAAADAAITELCNESDHAKEVFDESNSEVEMKLTLSNQEQLRSISFSFWLFSNKLGILSVFD